MSERVPVASSTVYPDADEARVFRLQFLATLVLVVALVLGLGAFFLRQHVTEFDAATALLEARTLADHETMLVREVRNAEDYVQYVRSRTEEVLKDEIRSTTDQGFEVAQGIWDEAKDRLPPDRIKALVREALRPVRFFGGRGYFFIDDLDGNCILLPTAPHLEGTSLLENRDDRGTYIMRSLIQAVSNPEGRGYARYRWYAPGDSTRMSEKIAYARVFEPFGWLIGAGDYVMAAEERLQREALERLRALRFGGAGYIAVLTTGGTVLLSPSRAASEGQHYLALEREESDVISRLLDRARQGGGMLRYDWINPATGRMAPKLSYVSAPNEWGWVLVAGVYLDDLAKDLHARREELGAGVRTRIVTTLSVLVAALVGAVAVSFLTNRWIRRIVGGYRHREQSSASELREHARQLLLANYFVERVSEVVVVADEALRIVHVNPYGCRVLGQGPEALAGTRAGLLEPFLASGDHSAERYETTLATPDGRELVLEVTASRIVHGETVHYCAIARDVSERRRTEGELRLAAMVFDNAEEGMLITNATNKVVAVNRAFTAITGYTREEVLGRDPRFLASGRQPAAFYAAFWESLRRTGQWSGEIWNRRKNGDVFPEWLSIHAVRDKAGVVTNYVAAFSDISDRVEAEERIRHLAAYDFVTDLPNRFLMRDRLERAVLGASRSGRRLALLHVDVDRFKTINDSLGHQVGDRLLRAVGQRLSEAVRASDTVSRHGADEFTVLLVDVATPEDAANVAHKLMEHASRPYEVDGHDLHVTVSTGIAIFPDDGTSIDALLKSADMAMYEAKQAGRNTSQFFTTEMNRRASERLWLESNLRRALDQGELELHFQPQFTAVGRRLVGAEALVRWRQADGRLVPPGQFIPLAEETGLILPLGDWVMNEACRCAKRLEGLAPLRIAVNLSAVQMRRPDMAERVLSALDENRLNPEMLELEVTESVLMDDAEAVMRVLARLRATGIALAIDDFGTGYSSLSYLRRFHVDRLKIDRSFIQGLGDGADDAAITEAVISMARSLRIETVAEGVETEAQLRRLEELGCDLVQGFHLGRPMPFAAFDAFAREYRVAAPSTAMAAPVP